MAKKVIAITIIPKVTCSGCKYNIPGDHSALMYCDKIKMPLPAASIKQCIYKTLK